VQFETLLTQLSAGFVRVSVYDLEAKNKQSQRRLICECLAVHTSGLFQSQVGVCVPNHFCRTIDGSPGSRCPSISPEDERGIG